MDKIIGGFHKGLNAGLKEKGLPEVPEVIAVAVMQSMLLLAIFLGCGVYAAIDLAWGAL